MRLDLAYIICDSLDLTILILEKIRGKWGMMYQGGGAKQGFAELMKKGADSTARKFLINDFRRDISLRASVLRVECQRENQDN